ncbi:hypothetical protein EYZ11_004617 [Aspergillus tanneri]|nr:hypothetical protein EYZ11_004617 [Aspergillus tanneri]
MVQLARFRRGAHITWTEIAAPDNEITNKTNQQITYHGHDDVPLNSAGFAQLGPVEVYDEEARYQFDFNFFNLLSFTRAIIPHMHKHQSGVIVLFSSIAGQQTGIGYGLYSAGNFAIDSIVEILSLELKQFNIRAHATEPGLFRTGFLHHRAEGEYFFKSIQDHTGVKEITNADGVQPHGPRKAAKRIFEVVTEIEAEQGVE